MVGRNEKKKEGRKTKKKKEGEKKILLGYCPTVSQYSEELYCDIAGLGGVVGLVCIVIGGLAERQVVSRYKHCIVTVDA